MKKLRSLFVAFALLAALVTCTFDATAQQKRISPHETISAVISGTRVTITYGRPYSKDPKSGEIRKIWGGLVPYGKAWRAGSDEATTLLTQNTLLFGTTEIPAGIYTLYMMPEEKGPSKLVFGKKTGGWGIPVDTKNDFAQVDLKMEPLDPPLDEFTMSVGSASKGGPGVIKLMWEKTQFSTEFTVKK
jgi:hypothetical protein